MCMRTHMTFKQETIWEGKGTIKAGGGVGADFKPNPTVSLSMKMS